MLCCIPVKHHFSFKSPKPKGSPPSNKRSRSGMPSTVQSDADAATESGIFYLVPNKHGPGKSLVRRPRPPPTSAPLPDDFDALTVAGQSTYTRRGGTGIRSGWETHGRAGAAGSVSPLDDDFDATYTAGATLTRKAGSSMDGYDGVKSWLKGSESSPGRSRHHGRGGSEEYADHRQQMDDMRRRLGQESPGLALTPTRNRKELSRNGTLTKERDPRIDMIGPPARLGSIPKPASSNTVPRAANEFQEINRRIVEDGPERTVLISTWREQVADAIDTETVVDVYYLNGDDYAEGAEEETQETRATTTRRRSIPPPPPSAPSIIGDDMSEIRSFRGPIDAKSITESFFSERLPTVPPKSSNRSFRLGSEAARDRSGSGASNTRAPPRAMTPESHMRRSSNSSSSHKVPSRRNLPLNTNLSPPRASTPARTRDDSFLGPRSSKALHQPITPSDMYGTNPVPPSFRPTQSGSTISTIKSASVLAFEDVLSTCEPSLLHISPALTNLGITNESHLKAITNMNEETRDRIVKEEALKQGITVMEWAILLDRLQSL